MDSVTPTSAPVSHTRESRKINLALQGGGTHGAFTWGVLERLLDEDWLDFDGMSGTSAGAINAAVFALGLSQGGRPGARDAMEKFWRGIGSSFAMSPMKASPIEKAIWGHDLSHSMAWNAFEALTRIVSPYQLNPLYREEVPTTVSDIMNRLNEISFNASLMSEMRAIDFVQRLLEGGRLEQPRYRRIFLHSIEDEVHMREFKLSTKFNGDWDFLQTLRRYGHAAADRFLSTSADAIGKDSSLDIQRYL